MPTKRSRVSRNLIPDVSSEELYFLSDGLLGEESEKDSWTIFMLKGNDKAVKALWDAHKKDILVEWIRQRPGRRPSLWWEYDAPRMTDAEVESRGWTGCYWVPSMCDPRRRLGGTGTPRHEVLNYVPSFHCGVPDSWVDQGDVEAYSEDFSGVPINANDPPEFESQASYLRRYGLLLPEEERARGARPGGGCSLNRAGRFSGNIGRSGGSAKEK